MTRRVMLRSRMLERKSALQGRRLHYGLGYSRGGVRIGSVSQDYGRGVRSSVEL